MTTGPDPFTALGLPVRPDLSDEQVRAAWRQVATATHPDRPDGGNPDRYRAASAAYAIMRTAWGRSEAYADLAAPLTGHVVPPAAIAARPLRLTPWRALALVPARIWHGRPARLVLRIVAAVVLAVLATRTGAGAPPIAGLVTGIGVAGADRTRRPGPGRRDADRDLP
jgi:hypothetical protein